MTEPTLSDADRKTIRQLLGQQFTVREAELYAAGKAAGRAELEAAVAAEREACAKVCEQDVYEPWTPASESPDYYQGRIACAAALRARKGAAT